MNDALSNFIYGAIGGGTVAAGLRIIENNLITPRLAESLEARRKLFHYGKPLWRVSDSLSSRLYQIQQKMDKPRTSLAASPRDAKTIDWFTTKQGNYITSTAYMIAEMASWIVLFERDVVFLQFGRKSLTASFLLKIRRFKDSISNKSNLWINYVDGIGEKLIKTDLSEPLNYSDFCFMILKEKEFLDYYIQLFNYLNAVNQGKCVSSIGDTIIALDDINSFLVANKIIVDTSQRNRR
ncbi:MAG: hypothetical protein AAFQ63_14275 [Cyanobacteria bacterium J06621_11]